jgi:hypothetical protein
MVTILGILTVISGFLAVFFKSKNNSSDALLNNQKTNESLNKVDQSISKNNGILEAEEFKRAELENKEAKNVSKQELVDFINNHHSNK